MAFNQVTTYAYDLGDRLTSLAGPSSPTAAFTFDATGRFATRVVSGSTDTYTYLGSSETVAAISTGGVLTASLLDPSGSRLANKNTSSGTAAYTLPDLHGDVAAAELTSGTNLADAFRYDGYGQTIATGGAGGGPTQPYRYQGRLDISPDTSQPVYDLGARFYQPSLGVFTQLDSVAGSAQDPLSLNRYLYAEANPATLIDPDGHIAMSGAGVDTSGTWSLATARVVQQIVATHVLQRAAQAKAQPKQGSGFNLLGFLGTAGKVAWGVTTRQVSHLLELPGAAVSLAWRTPGAIAAAPGAIADAARNPGRAWNTVSTGAIVGFRDWTTSMHDNLVSGDPDRIAAGISGSIDVAWLATGVAGAGKAAASRVAAGDRVFWSGGEIAKNAAADFARANGSTTLEMSLTGRALERLPYNRFTAKLWDAASARFARGAMGDAHVFFGPNAPLPRSVFARIEGPILDARGIRILQHFLVDE